MLVEFTEEEHTASIDAARAVAIPGDLPEWATAEPLPTIATLRQHWIEAEAAMEAEAHQSELDWNTAGEPEAWACPPPCEACYDSVKPCGLCGGVGYGDEQ